METKIRHKECVLSCKSVHYFGTINSLFFATPKQTFIIVKKFSRTSYHLTNNFIYQKPNYHFLADEESSICLYQIQKISLPQGQLFLSTLVPKYPRKNAYVNVQLVT